MASASIRFGNLLSSGQEVLAGAMPSSLNVCVDATGTVRRRPGIQTHAAAPASAFVSGLVDGLHVTPAGVLFASGENGVSATRELHRIAGGGAVDIGDLSGGRRAVFADTEALVVVANGKDVFKAPKGGGAVSLLGGSPPLASHVIFNASRLLTNDLVTDRSKVNFSSPASGTVTTGHEQWGGTGTSGFFSAEAKPDPVVALGENSNEVYVWGATNLEIYAPDSLLTFARVAARDYGCVAPYSVIPYDNTFIWLDHRRRVVRSDGRVVQDISEPIVKTLDGLSTVSDAFAYRVNEGPADCVVVDFQTDELTLALQSGGGWSQWGAYEGGQIRQFPVSSCAHDPTTDTTFVGLRDGRVAQLVDGVADDLGDPIVAFAESGFVDHGTSARKVNRRLHITLRRGEASSDGDTVAFLEWADSEGKWSNKRPIHLGPSGDTYPVVTLYSLGVYRRRNWRFTFSEAVDLALVSIEEEYDIAEEG